VKPKPLFAMIKLLLNPKILLFLPFFGLLSCDEDDDNPGLRTKIDYSTLGPETPYATAFADSEGNTTVDLTEGNVLHKMFYSINNHITTSTSANEQISAEKLKNMFSNTGNEFFDINTATVSIDGDELNNSGIDLRSVTASSRPSAEAEAERQKFEGYFDQIETASLSVEETASQGQAGKLDSRLVDERGIELVQIIQKSLIGALQLDYIGNVLMDEGLTADNAQLVSDKNYTALEHNWDIAYGLLTLNPVYLEGSTNETRGTSEFGAGSYIWEYNKESYAEIHPAFLKGRAAIANNDRATLEAQATLIRTAIEKALAAAALGYLDKWRDGTTDAARAHAIGEGLGFIYSLRFATIHEGNSEWSDSVIEALIGSANGYWDLTAAKINAAEEAIKTKFEL
jgi:hypothetical protein